MNRNFKIKVAFTCIMLFIYSCNSNSSVFKDEPALKSLFLKLNWKVPNERCTILIQSNLGCGACNELVIAFIKKNYLNRKLHSIVPFISHKESLIRYTEKIIKHNKLLIDKNNDAVKLGLTLEHSIIVYMEKGIVVDIVHLNPINVEIELEKLKIMSQ